MLAVSRLQLCSVRSGVLGNQRVRDLDSIVSSVLTQVDTRPTTRFRVDWNTRQRREEIVQSVVLIRAGAVSEFSDLTGEYRTAASEWLKSIHLETTSAFLPRETSIRMSESTRTVISCEGGLGGRPDGGFEHPCEFRQILASPSSARSAWRGNAHEGLPARVPRQSSFDSAREREGIPEMIVEVQLRPPHI
jgi:hypothetical protein